MIDATNVITSKSLLILALATLKNIMKGEVIHRKQYIDEKSFHRLLPFLNSSLCERPLVMGNIRQEVASVV